MSDRNPLSSDWSAEDFGIRPRKVPEAMKAQEITIRIPAGVSDADSRALFDQVCTLVGGYAAFDWPRMTVGMLRSASDPAGPDTYLTPGAARIADALRGLSPEEREAWRTAGYPPEEATP